MQQRSRLTWLLAPSVERKTEPREEVVVMGPSEELMDENLEQSLVMKRMPVSQTGRQSGLASLVSKSRRSFLKSACNSAQGSRS